MIHAQKYLWIVQSIADCLMNLLELFLFPGISEKNTQSENGKTEAILRESRNARRNAEVECRNSADDRRIVRNAETQSVFTAEQRRLEEQKRLDEKERARAARKRNKRRSGPEL